MTGKEALTHHFAVELGKGDENYMASNLVKKYLWKCPILLHSMVNLVVLILKLYIIVILINLGFSKSQRPLSGSEIN